MDFIHENMLKMKTTLRVFWYLGLGWLTGIGTQFLLKDSVEVFSSTGEPGWWLVQGILYLLMGTVLSVYVVRKEKRDGKRYI